MNSSSNVDIAIICRGDKMKTWCGFSDIISSALQFPYYYSGSSGSFDECLCDLAWIFKKRIFVFITDFDKVLSEDHYDFLYLFKKSVNEVSPWIKECQNTERHVYYIFQNIDGDFPLFEEEGVTEYKWEYK